MPKCFAAESTRNEAVTGDSRVEFPPFQLKHLDAQLEGEARVHKKQQTDRQEENSAVPETFPGLTLVIAIHPPRIHCEVASAPPIGLVLAAVGEYVHTRFPLAVRAPYFGVVAVAVVTHHTSIIVIRHASVVAEEIISIPLDKWGPPPTN